MTDVLAALNDGPMTGREMRDRFKITARQVWDQVNRGAIRLRWDCRWELVSDENDRERNG